MKVVPIVSVLFLSLQTFAASQPAKPVAIKIGASTVEFKAIGRPSALKVIGKGTGLEGALALKGNVITGDLVFDLNGLGTGISMRDEHMKKKYLETEKFPKAKLTILELRLPESAAKGDFVATSVPFSGKLSLHGVEKQVEGKANVTRKGSSGTAEATFATKITEYGIAVPSFSGITIADDVDIKVDTSGTFGENTAQ